MKTIAVIPARYASTRFPGKPLVDIRGKSMIQRVYEQGMKAKLLSEVWVATDDERIFEHVKGFGGKVIMTSSAHETGTERCAEVLERKAFDCDILLNIQGDEPFIQPEQIDLLVEFMSKHFYNVHVATLAKRLTDSSRLFNPNTIKVMFDHYRKAMYFSRTAIPYLRKWPKEEWTKHHTFYKHIGLYAFRASILPTLVGLSPSPLEQAESLEQLRWMQHGYLVGVVETEMESQSVDVPEDLFDL